jgi:hypothetical protein
MNLAAWINNRIITQSLAVLSSGLISPVMSIQEPELDDSKIFNQHRKRCHRNGKSSVVKKRKGIMLCQ